MFRQKVLIILFIVLAKGFLQAQDPSVPPEKPKLIIGVVISGMRYDCITRYWNKFGEGGFKKLVNKGVFCKNAHHDYLIAESGAGYASIATGAYPDVHGIVSDYWYDRLRNKVTNCIESEKAATIGGSYEEGRYSPARMLAGTLSDQARVASQFNSKVISISLDPRAAILSGGHTANAAYWFDNQYGKWITSSYYYDSIPFWVNDFNSKELSGIYLDKVWETLYPISEYTESIADNNKYEKGLGGRVTFPYDLKILSPAKKNKRNFEILKFTPYGNTYTKDFAIAAIVNENLGKGEYTDWLQLSFSATSYLGKNFPVWSVEMEDTYLRLDKDLEHFLNFIDEQVKMKNVLIYLTSENALADNPTFLADNGMPSGYFNYNNAMFLLKTYLNLIYGNGEWVNFYYAQQIYLNRQLIDDSKLSFVDFQDRVSGFMTQFEGVSNALTSVNMLTNNYTRGYFEKIQKSFSQKRSGDILLHLSPGWIEKGVDTEYESSLHYDTHVPLIFYGWKLGRTSITRPVSVTDIMPSIALLLDMTRPGSIEGNLIEELF
jgi:predicted AlkP superfamily pyrophosphatase or phosphodiesterase